MKLTGFSSCRTFSVLLAISLSQGLFSKSLHAQSLNIDPLDPFAKITSAQDWAQQFRVVRELDPEDPFHNMDALEWWRQTWLGQWRTAADNGISFEEFYDSLQGDAGNSYILRSPYPYESAEAHWNTWLADANGGTTHTRTTLPDWSGDWRGGERGISGGALVRDYYEAVSEDYKQYYLESLQSELEGRAWWPADTCLPNGYGRDGWRVRYIMMDPEKVIFIKDMPVTTNRYVFTDARGFLPDAYAFPQWEGESQGFWDGEELIVWTTNIKGWYGGHGQPEYSDALQIIERWKLIGEQLVADLTLYDPLAYAYPWHDVAVFNRVETIEGWQENAPTVSECVSTNNTYHDQHGQLAEYALGDDLYNDLFDLRPWDTAFKKAEAAKAAGIYPEAPLFMQLEQD
jgi:hypothetical protein